MFVSGKKYDDGKAPLYSGCLQYFPRALEAVAQVSAYGAKKYKVPYEEQNWRKVEDGRERYTDAMARHQLGEAKNDNVDPESGLAEDAMVAWNALARLELRLSQAAAQEEWVQYWRTPRMWEQAVRDGRWEVYLRYGYEGSSGLKCWVRRVDVVRTDPVRKTAVLRPGAEIRWEDPNG